MGPIPRLLEIIERARQFAHNCHEKRRFRWPVLFLFYTPSVTVLWAIILLYCYRNVDL